MEGRIDDIFELILNSDPSESTFLLLLYRLKNKGRPEEIIRWCLEAKKRGHNSPELSHLLAEAYLEKGFIGLAEIEIALVISEVEKYSSAYKLMAEILMSQKRPEKAKKFLKIYLFHNPDDAWASGLLEKIKIGKGAQNERDYEYLSEKEPLTDFASPTSAEISYQQGQIDDAIGIYEKFLAQNPGHKEAENRLKELKAMNLKDEKALSSALRYDRDNKKRLINILEGWLLKLREQKIEY